MDTLKSNKDNFLIGERKQAGVQTPDKKHGRLLACERR